MRVGFDLFERCGSCSRTGQPLEHAHIPTLDIHIAMLRDWILGRRDPARGDSPELRPATASPSA